MIYETVILPGDGLGNLVKLGDSMFSVVNRLNNANYKLKISYSDTDYLNVPVVVTVVKLGVRLTFRNHREQTLDLIELLHLIPDHSSSSGDASEAKVSGTPGAPAKHHDSLRILYKNVSLNEFGSSSYGHTLSEASTSNSSSSSISETCSSTSSATLTSSNSRVVASSSITLKSIYNKIFGPTYPGKSSSSGQFYVLSYPGVSFKFKIFSADLSHKVQAALSSKTNETSKVDEAILSILLNWEKPDDVICDSIALYKGNSWDDFDFKGVMKPGENDWVKDTEISKLSADLRNGRIDVEFGNRTSADESNPSTTLLIGSTTQQEVVNLLGPPDDYFNKSDSRLLIHNHLPFLAKQETGSDIGADDQDISHYKFHNYFRYGIDIMYDINNSGPVFNQNSSNTVIKKIIIHNGGVTESLSFMKWNRCNWEIKTTLDNNELVIDSTMYLKDFPEQIKKVTPVLLNRNESEFIDNDLDIIELPESLSITDRTNREKYSAQKVKTWGQSKLHGLAHCIFEAVEATGCISSVTIY